MEIVIKKKKLCGEDGYKLLSIKIPIELYETLDRIAEDANTSRNEVINILLEESSKSVKITE